MNSAGDSESSPRRGGPVFWMPALLVAVGVASFAVVADSSIVFLALLMELRPSILTWTTILLRETGGTGGTRESGERCDSKCE